ncbi:hypothetical protein AZI85_10690 [Bdellovibrio bacteriovorus]|uniref:DUF3750 domain-containing protein n=1 Tax=Bdellovibrio bacteriovorus TaxID=959 RepID=A0A150WDJ2_BDEBC|nr:DUF3750 domain-containing protein [Bdellovibrio bacteriovorus]KYG60942.1 hypothetical protein AZI85_10690 [Bdellovibrio bacteriovorus]
MKKLFPFFVGFFAFSNSFAQDWRTATRDSAGIAPDPHSEKRAVVQVYAARTVDWRGYFAVHSWIATKEKDANEYTTYHVIGWRVRRGQESVVVQKDIPDRHWFGARPELLEDLRGEEAEKAIPQIASLAANYAYKNTYRAYPGPNSNTFISHIIRNVPELKMELPPTAIGKDWINQGDVVGWSESKTGVQFSLLGLFGFTVGLNEGVELNLLGLNFGIDFLRPALKLPMVGRVGMKDKAF